MRVRPGRRSRPRTKDRPAHADATDGFVTAVDRGRYTCLVRGSLPTRDGHGDGSRPAEHDDERIVTAMRARELRRRPIVVGDHVALVGDTSGDRGTLARIVRIAERQSILRRSADDTDPAERIVVANADLLLIVVATTEPAPRTGFIDRCLVAAYTGHLQPALLVTKTDLHDPADLLAQYASLQLTTLTSGRAESGRRLDDDAVDQVRALLAGRMTALIGQSGVGKSTLVNTLVPEAGRAIGSVTGAGKGRHTSTSAVALPLADGGWIVDTPGVRSFGLAHATADDLIEAFDDLLPATADCPPGCTHAAARSGCALDGLVAAGGASATRLASFRRLLASGADALAIRPR